MRLSSEAKNESQVRKYLEWIGESEAVRRFISKYGSLNTQKAYLLALAFYFEWLRKKGIRLTPDQLITDNLECIFKNDPTDVKTKRKHLGWMDEYVNAHILKQGYSESMRNLVVAAIKEFYKRNDSPFFGDFQLAKQPILPPPRWATDPSPFTLD